MVISAQNILRLLCFLCKDESSQQEENEDAEQKVESDEENKKDAITEKQEEEKPKEIVTPVSTPKSKKENPLDWPYYP